MLRSLATIGWLEKHPVIRLADQYTWVFQTAARGGLGNPPHTQLLLDDGSPEHSNPILCMYTVPVGPWGEGVLDVTLRRVTQSGDPETTPEASLRDPTGISYMHVWD